MRNKFTLLLLIFVLISGGVYQWGGFSSPSESTEDIERRVKMDFVRLTEKEFAEYQNLKTLEERYKKADEIFGKIFTVFLADLSLRVRPTAVPVQELTSTTQGPALPAAKEAPPSESPNGATQPVQLQPAPTKTPQDALGLTPSPPTTSIAEANPSSESGTRSPKNPLISDRLGALRGQHLGVIKFKDGRGSWLINLNLKSENSLTTGTLSLRDLSTDKSILTQRISNLRANKSRIVVPISRLESRLEMRPADNTGERWQGDYFERDENRTLVSAGTFVLFKP